MHAVDGIAADESFVLSQAKENTNFVMKKLESAKKSLRTAEIRHESHMQVIQDLKKQLDEIQGKRREYEEQV